MPMADDFIAEQERRRAKNVRAYLDGLSIIFMNAIFRGSAHARPVR